MCAEDDEFLAAEQHHAQERERLGQEEWERLYYIRCFHLWAEAHGGRRVREEIEIRVRDLSTLPSSVSRNGAVAGGDISYSGLRESLDSLCPASQAVAVPACTAYPLSVCLLLQTYPVLLSAEPPIFSQDKVLPCRLLVPKMRRILSSCGCHDTGPYLSDTWGSAVALAQYVLAKPYLFTGKDVVELGAGTGLPSLVASR